MLKNNIYEITSKNGEFQKTVKNKLSISGGSPYTNEECIIDILPANENKGIRFVTQNQTEIASLISNAKDDNDVHTTSLIKDGEEIKTVEHLLSAIWGLGIDNAVVKMHTKHLPFLDASAKGYASEIVKIGLKNQKQLRRYIKVLNDQKFTETSNDDRYAIIKPSDLTIIRCTTSFNNIVGTKTVNYEWNEDKYIDEISFARTFLRSPLDDEGKVWTYVKKLFPFIPVDPQNSPIIVFDDKKFITPLQKEDEPARHKVLDFIGDISLLGYRLLAEIEVNLPGHRFTRQIVKEITTNLS